MKQICKYSGEEFEISDQDLEFYRLMDVPPPTISPIMRMLWRLSYRNERYLYRRNCDLTGKSIISAFSKEKPFPVYGIDAWWSDNWDAMSYGNVYDFNRSFFEQFFALRNQVPRLALQQQQPMENSEYCNCASRNKNCYLTFSTNYCEDCYYGSWVNNSRDCMDTKVVNDCELCYECVDCWSSYNLRYGQECLNCKSSMFLWNCLGCSDCFGCCNLVNKQYFIFNKAHTKKEYEDFLEKFDSGSYSAVEGMRKFLEEKFNDRIVKFYQGMNVENSTGNYIRNLKNCFYVFESDDCEDLRYCHNLNNARTAMDYSHWGGNAERIYFSQACGYDVFNLRFCNLCWSGCNDLIYCDHTFSSRDCFGCVGLKKKQYCILNKQYSKEEYEELMPRIVEHMKSTGEWGEFFPPDQSTFAYNETLAYEQVPLSKEEILAKGWIWKELEKENKTGDSYELPDHINDVGDEVLGKILISKKSGDAYKIIMAELDFYRRSKIPLPRLTPDERHFARLAKRTKNFLYQRECEKCGVELKTAYDENRPEKVDCEKCYLEAVY